MTFPRVLLVLFAAALSASTAFASNKATAADAEAASLIDRAKQLSDIRAEGSTPFRLQLDFKARREDGSVLEGTYTEIWASRDQWRRETVIGDLRRMEVEFNQQKWLVESTQPFPEQVRNLPALSDLGRFRHEVWKPGSIETRKVSSDTLRCINAAPEPLAASLVVDAQHIGKARVPMLCFDASSGVLVAEIEPHDNYDNRRKAGEHTSSCYLTDYQKFGERFLAKSYHCAEDGHVTLDASIAKLVTWKPDPASFVLIGGVKERTGCPDPIHEPRVVYQRAPSRFSGSGTTVITLNVDVDGAPRDLAVASSPSRDMGKSALEAVRLWRFKPTSCDEEPFETKIAVEIKAQVH